VSSVKLLCTVLSIMCSILTLPNCYDVNNVKNEHKLANFGIELDKTGTYICIIIFTKRINIMKRTIRNCSLLVLALMVNLSHAKENDSLLIIHENEFKSFTKKNSEETFKYQLYIKNQKGQILYEEKMDDGKFLTSKFDFEKLPNGSYQAELIDGFRTQILPMKVKNDTLVPLYEEASVFFEPTVYKRGKSVYINLYSPEKSNLFVAIYDQTDQLVYSSSMRGKGTLGKVFDFSKMELGNYKLSLNHQGRDYIKTIEVL
jgi:hypothetical protein